MIYLHLLHLKCNKKCVKFKYVVFNSSRGAKTSKNNSNSPKTDAADQDPARGGFCKTFLQLFLRRETNRVCPRVGARLNRRPSGGSRFSNCLTRWLRCDWQDGARDALDAPAFIGKTPHAAEWKFGCACCCWVKGYCKRESIKKAKMC